MPDPRIAALAEALHSIHGGPAPWPGGMTSEECAAAILAELPDDWCGHGAEMLTVDGILAHNEEVMADLARLRKIEEAARVVSDYAEIHFHERPSTPMWWVSDRLLHALRAALDKAKEAGK